jgi:predicted  nucleic acid-binding Zn-ribbon protein
MKVMSYLNTQHTRSSRIFRFTTLVAIVSAACLALPQASGAQTLADWQTAQTAANDRKGPESIPYASLQEAARNKQGSVGQRCKVETWNCDALGTKSIRETIKGLTFKIDENKKKLDELNNTLSAAKTEAEKQVIQATIVTAKQEMERMTSLLADKTKRLENDLKDIDERIGKGNDCLKARTAAQDVYMEAYNRARSGESDPAIKVIANVLTVYWETRRQEHETIMKDAVLGIQKCQTCRNGDL